MKLSPHFSLDEFTTSQEAVRRGIRNEPGEDGLKNLRKLADTLEQVRALLGHPIVISSGFRCRELNKAIGGSKTSAHMTGRAADFTCPGFGTPFEVAQAIAASGIVFDQLIHEYGRWVHIGIADIPRQELLTATKAGYRQGIKTA